MQRNAAQPARRMYCGRNAPTGRPQRKRHVRRQMQISRISSPRMTTDRHPFSCLVCSPLAFCPARQRNRRALHCARRPAPSLSSYSRAYSPVVKPGRQASAIFTQKTAVAPSSIRTPLPPVQLTMASRRGIAAVRHRHLSKIK